MNDFKYKCETKLVFGKNTENKVGEEVKPYGNKILILYGSDRIKKSGLFQKITKSLTKENITFVELGGVQPNPRLELVHQGVKLCREEEAQFILAVGGGSVIDTAKAIGIGYYYDGDVWDFYEKRMRAQKALPVGVILTLPAAGSESSPSSVVSYGDRKLGTSGDVLRPRFALLNPELTYSLPKKQTVAGIADMYAHIVERYFTNTRHVDLTDNMCEAVMKNIVKNARLVVGEPSNYDYRAEIMLSGTIAHNGVLGMGREEDWASHGIEHELSARYDATHGEGLAVIIPAWMKYVYKHDVARFAQYGRNVWGLTGEDEEVAVASIEATKSFFKEIGLPTTLEELGIDDTYLGEMAQKCTPTGRFVRLDAEDIEKIYRLAL